MSINVLSTEKNSHMAASAAYDNITYNSKPFPQTNPLLLQGIGRLFGIDAASPYKSRILEIGCATGANLMAIASLYPDSVCVGIDYSERQISIGNKELKERALANCELKHLSVIDVNKDFGVFDYIICHGVMSWVPQEVQEKIFEVCRNNLSGNGIAYISYNTLPGWSIMGAVRDMVVYHTAQFEQPDIKAQQARHVLKLLGETMRYSQNPMAQVIDSELKRLEPLPDYYLLHEYMEDINLPFYFHEFIKRANYHGLQYLADTDIEIMFSGNLPPVIANAIPPSNDFIRIQQYIDFIGMRRFRNTLLCHKESSVDINIPAERLKNGYLLAKFEYPPHFREYTITNGQALQFRSSPSNITITVSDPLQITMLQVFCEQGCDLITVTELTKKVAEKLKKAKLSFNEAILEQNICLHVLRYVFTRGILFFAEKAPYATILSKKPTVSPMVRYQATRQDWVTNQLLEDFIQPPLFDKTLIQYTDGTHTIDDLCQAMLAHFKSGELAFGDIDNNDLNAVKKALPTIIKKSLQRFAAIEIMVT